LIILNIYKTTQMRATNIKFLLGLKKMGDAIIFRDCPQCKRFFGTNEAHAETCSIDCDSKYALRRQQVEEERKYRLQILQARKLMQN
jgi:hypothetical protein